MMLYQIQLRGHLDPGWETLFSDFTISHQVTSDGQPITVMIGGVIDQSALYGTISRLRDLGVELISIQPQTNSDTETLDSEGE